MEASRETTSFAVSYGVGVAVVILLSYAWRFFNWAWLKPKKMEKFLRDQGLHGSSYKFLFGDLKSVTTHGKDCFTWLGSRPVVHITEPAMIREILVNYNLFQKPRGGNPLTKLQAKGLVDAEADQWAKHRKIINPAFHAEKLKHMVLAFYVSSSERIGKWEEMFKEESSCEVDVWPHLQTMSSNVISRTAFGSSYEEGRKIFELQ